MSPAEILRVAREKISAPKHWTKGEYARDGHGKPVFSQSPDAVCWCARGAIYAADPDDKDRLSHRFLREAIQEQAGHDSIVGFNDGTRHDRVLAAFDRAIQLAEARS